MFPLIPIIAGAAASIGGTVIGEEITKKDKKEPQEGKGPQEKKGPEEKKSDKSSVPTDSPPKSEVDF